MLHLQRKRKKEQEDTLSSHSMCVGEDEGPSKRKKRLGRVASLANIFASSPISKPLQNAKQALKKSISGMLHPANEVQGTPLQEQSPTPSLLSVPSSPLLRSHKSIMSLNRLSVSFRLLCTQAKDLNSDMLFL